MVSVLKRVYSCESHPGEDLVSCAFNTVAPIDLSVSVKPDPRAPTPVMPRQLAPLSAVLCTGTHRRANRSIVEANEKEQWLKRASGRLE